MNLGNNKHKYCAARWWQTFVLIICLFCVVRYYFFTHLVISQSCTHVYGNRRVSSFGIVDGRTRYRGLVSGEGKRSSSFRSCPDWSPPCFQQNGFRGGDVTLVNVWQYDDDGKRVYIAANTVQTRIYSDFFIPAQVTLQTNPYGIFQYYIRDTSLQNKQWLIWRAVALFFVTEYVCYTY